MRRMRFLLTIILSLVFFNTIAEEAKLLTLQDAILLSLRYNASVRTAELQRVEDKFSLELAKWQFQPHYTLTGSTMAWSTSRTPGAFQPMTSSWSVAPAVSWESPIGTTVNVSPNTWTNGAPGRPGVSIDITQPLIAGFGRAVVEAALEDAYDDEKISKLNLRNAIISQVTATISAYTTLLTAENSVTVDEESVGRAKTNLEQTKLYIQAGQNPKSDEVQAQSQLAQTMTQLQSDKTSVILDRYALLQAIGLPPTANIQITHDVSLEKYHLLSEKQAIDAVLENNIGYQTSIITIAKTARAVMKTKDATRWQLNFEEIYSRGGPDANNGGVNNILNNSAYSSTTSLNLTIPIDDKNNQGAILNANIALQEAQLNLNQAKQDLTLQAMSTRDSLINAAEQIKLNQNQAGYDEQALQDTMRSYRAGMASSLQVAQQSQTYAADQRNVVLAKISYFEALANFDQLYGHTLDTWGIHVQY